MSTVSRFAFDDPSTLTSFNLYSQEPVEDNDEGVLSKFISKFKTAVSGQQDLAQRTPLQRQHQRLYQHASSSSSIQSFNEKATGHSGSSASSIKQSEFTLVPEPVPLVKTSSCDSDTQSVMTTFSVSNSNSLTRILSRLRGEDPSKEFWMPDETCNECFECGSQFNFFKRKHHCRVCGQIFCGKCVAHVIQGEWVNQKNDIRVCNFCFSKFERQEEARSIHDALMMSSNRTSLDLDLALSSPTAPDQSPIAIVPDMQIPTTSLKEHVDYGGHSSVALEIPARPLTPRPSTSVNSYDRTDLGLKKFLAVNKSGMLRPRSRINTMTSLMMEASSSSTNLHSPMPFRRNSLTLSSSFYDGGGGTIVPSDDLGCFSDEEDDSRHNPRHVLHFLGGSQANLNERPTSMIITGSTADLFSSQQNLSSSSKPPSSGSSSSHAKSVTQQLPTDDEDHALVNMRAERRERSNSVRRRLSMTGSRSVRVRTQSFLRNAPPLSWDPTSPHHPPQQQYHHLHHFHQHHHLLSQHHHHHHPPLHAHQQHPSSSSLDTASEMAVSTFNSDSDTGAAPGLTVEDATLFLPDAAIMTMVPPAAIRPAARLDDTPPPPAAQFHPMALTYLQRMIDQLLQDSPDVTDHIDQWQSTLMSLLLKVADSVCPDVLGGDEMDVRHYVKIKAIPGGRPTDSFSVNGVVCSKNVAHKDMARNLERPKILILMFSLEWSRGDEETRQQFQPIQPVLDQEQKYLEKLINRIRVLEPTMVLVQGNVPRLALEFLRLANLVVVFNVKLSVLDAVSRCTGATMVSSFLQLNKDKIVLGECGKFELLTLMHESIPNRRKTFMLFHDCPPELGATIILRGNPSCLDAVKRILDFLVFVVYHLKLESSYLHDFALMRNAPPFDGSDACVDDLQVASQPSGMGEEDPCLQIVNAMIQKYENTMVCASWCVRFPPPYLLLRLKDTQAKLFTLIHQFVKEASAAHPTAMNLVLSNLPSTLASMPTYFRNMNHFVPITKTNEYEQLLEEHTQRWRALDGAFREDLGQVSPLLYQQCVVLYNLVCTVTAVPCDDPQVRRLDYYRPPSDLTLGQYVEDMLASIDMPCRSEMCDRSLLYHYRSYSHDHARVTVKVERLQGVQSTAAAPSDTLSTWSYCRHCSAHTRLTPLSHGAWKLSFGKFLELLLYQQDPQPSPFHRPHAAPGRAADPLVFVSPSTPLQQDNGDIDVASSLSDSAPTDNTHQASSDDRTREDGCLECAHGLLRDHVFFFSMHDLAVRFQYEPIQPLEIYAPPMHVYTNTSILTTIKDDWHESIRSQISRFYDSIVDRNKAFSFDVIQPTNIDLCKDQLQTMSRAAVGEKKNMLQYLQSAYATTDPTDSLQLNAVRVELQMNVLHWEAEYIELLRQHIKPQRELRRLTSSHLKKILNTGLEVDDDDGTTLPMEDTADLDKRATRVIESEDLPLMDIMDVDDDRCMDSQSLLMTAPRLGSSPTAGPVLSTLPEPDDDLQLIGPGSDVARRLSLELMQQTHHATIFSASLDPTASSLGSSAQPAGATVKDQNAKLVAGPSDLVLPEDQLLRSKSSPLMTRPKRRDAQPTTSRIPQLSSTMTMASIAKTGLGDLKQAVKSSKIDQPRVQGKQMTSSAATADRHADTSSSEHAPPAALLPTSPSSSSSSSSLVSHLTRKHHRLPFRMTTLSTTPTAKLTELDPPPSPHKSKTTAEKKNVHAHSGMEDHTRSLSLKGFRYRYQGHSSLSVNDTSHIEPQHSASTGRIYQPLQRSATEINTSSKAALRNYLLSDSKTMLRSRTVRQRLASRASLEVYTTIRDMVRDESDDEFQQNDQDGEDVLRLDDLLAHDLKTHHQQQVPAHPFELHGAPSPSTSASLLPSAFTPLLSHGSPFSLTLTDEFDEAFYRAQQDSFSSSHTKHSQRRSSTLPPTSSSLSSSFSSSPHLRSSHLSHGLPHLTFDMDEEHQGKPDPSTLSTLGHHAAGSTPMDGNSFQLQHYNTMPLPTSAPITNSFSLDSSAVDLTVPGNQGNSFIKALANMLAERGLGNLLPLEYPLSPLEHVFPNSIIVVSEDEPSTVVAAALTSDEYVNKLQDIRDQQHLDDASGQVSDSSKQDEEKSPDDSFIERTLRSKSGIHMKLYFTDGTTKFFCKIFFAEQFDALRRNCGCDENFIASLAHCAKWDSSGGKSGSTFLKTDDGRYLLKQISKYEMDAFVKFAHSYFQYLSEAFFHELPTVLCKIFGLYRVGYKNMTTGKSTRMDILVMENLFYDRCVKKIFDLKGSMRNRHVQVTGKENEVLLDENMVEYLLQSPLFLRAHAKQLLRESLHNDTLFLSRLDVMDYSLLVAIDEEKQELVVGIVGKYENKKKGAFSDRFVGG
ncbi:hypothetical protein DM01DRAFT_1099952 [Hesseltinella vesiculosa]|uniref:1-phosphatidylinositol-3-phosphate 5-kinase n=1 Tax=Hesseltinella vesiculosa TaxID=101127 RepID=A0A1X2GC15_9FUNG|nr:hypothetical protein DM01DRAFT_1099952 [Hesseltinella vesiculosa]